MEAGHVGNGESTSMNKGDNCEPMEKGSDSLRSQNRYIMHFS